MKINEIIQQPEGRRLEFKQELPPDNPKLNHQEVAAIMIAFVRIIDSYESK